MKKLCAKVFALLLCACFVCTALPTVSFAADEYEVHYGMVGIGEYISLEDDIVYGDGTDAEIVSGSLPDGLELYHYAGSNGYKEWRIEGWYAASGRYRCSIRLYSDNDTIGKTWNLLFYVYDEGDNIYENEMVCSLWNTTVTTITDPMAIYAVTDGALPSGLSLVADFDEESGTGEVLLTGVLGETGTCGFDITVVDKGVTTIERYFITIVRQPILEQDAYALYESFEGTMPGWISDGAFQSLEFDDAYEGFRIVSLNDTGDTLISPSFSETCANDVMLTWCDFAEEGERYALYAYTGDSENPKIEDFTHMGNYTTTGEWTMRGIRLNGETRIAFKHLGTKELWLDLVMVTKGYDETKVLEQAYSGYEYSAVIAEYPSGSSYHVFRGMPDGFGIETELSADSTATIYKLCGMNHDFMADYNIEIEYRAEDGSTLTITRYSLHMRPGTVGDVNGDGAMNTGDAAMILRSTVDLITLNEIEQDLADTNGDDKVDTADATRVIRLLVGLW